jgi:hypothetical protein
LGAEMSIKGIKIYQKIIIFILKKKKEINEVFEYQDRVIV